MGRYLGVAASSGISRHFDEKPVSVARPQATGRSHRCRRARRRRAALVAPVPWPDRQPARLGAVRTRRGLLDPRRRGQRVVAGGSVRVAPLHAGRHRDDRHHRHHLRHRLGTDAGRWAWCSAWPTACGRWARPRPGRPSFSASCSSAWARSASPSASCPRWSPSHWCRPSPSWPWWDWSSPSNCSGWLFGAKERSDSALVEAEARFRGSFDGAPIGICLVSVDGGHPAGQPCVRGHSGIRSPARPGRHPHRGPDPS